MTTPSGEGPPTTDEMMQSAPADEATRVDSTMHDGASAMGAGLGLGTRELDDEDEEADPDFVPGEEDDDEDDYRERTATRRRRTAIGSGSSAGGLAIARRTRAQHPLTDVEIADLAGTRMRDGSPTLHSSISDAEWSRDTRGDALAADLDALGAIAPRPSCPQRICRRTSGRRRS
jgi:hypothetical protein